MWPYTFFALHAGLVSRKSRRGRGTLNDKRSEEIQFNDSIPVVDWIERHADRWLADFCFAVFVISS
jgi:hypothetical protein